MTDPTSTPINHASAHSLATAVLGSPVVPVDFLVEHVRHAADASDWIINALRLVCSAPLPLPTVEWSTPENVPVGAVNLAEWLCDLDRETLDRIRARAVVLFGAASRIDERNQALMAYALAVATGLIEHGTLLTNQARRDVDLMMAELAAVAPAPIAAVFERALLCDAGC
jgi:hypothetical protein